jgi:hypothetical protein
MDKRAVSKHEWVNVQYAEPPEGVLVDTKIDDEKGCRNEQPLCRRGRLYFTNATGDAMYVYYTPTHWRAHSAGATPE